MGQWLSSSSNKPKYLNIAPEQVKSKLTGKRVLIVGGTAGIGRALTIQLLANGASVTIVGRRQPDQELAAAKFIQKDLSSMKSAKGLAKDLAKEWATLDAVVLTNGIISSPEREETSEGIEKDLAVSYLSRFVFSEQVFEQQQQQKVKSSSSKKPRVFIMGFPGKPNTATLDDFNSEKEYKAIPAHMNTVVGNEALVRYWAEQYPGGVQVYGLNPGLIQTGIRERIFVNHPWVMSIVESMISLFFQSAEQYAQRVLVPLLATDEQEDAESFKNRTLFEADGTILQPNPFLQDEQNYQKLIVESKKLAQKALSA